jgi:hypothetical protein
MREAPSLGDATRRALDELHDKGLNFDLERRGQFTPENGWRVDDYRQPLPSEPPGRPLPDGSWQAARRLIGDYAFADPSIVQAVYYPDRPLEQRDMLLKGQFLGLRFYFGCRVGGVNDELRTIDGRQARVWGWNYRTLQGHLEMGQMDYEVWKWLDSGTVEFRIHVVSKPAHIPNPVIRLGFRVFGRAMQRRFARHACRRMAQLTSTALHRGPGADGEQTVPPLSGQLTVAPAAGQARTRRRLARHAAVPTTDEAKPHRSRAPFTGRVAVGTLVGAAVYQDADRAAWHGAVAGAAAAAASAFALARVRTALGRRTPLPDPAWGIVEDALALMLGLLAIRARPGRST